MLIYEGTKDNFLSSVEQDTIAVEIESNIYERMHHHTACKQPLFADSRAVFSGQSRPY